MNSPLQCEIRAFVAVELPSKNLDSVADLVSSLRQERLSSLQLIKPENAHLTLKFLGQVPVSRLTELRKTLDKVAFNKEAFQIAFEGLGGFPNNINPSILWVGLNDTDGFLQMLASALDEALAPMGFRPETRKFTAHITLARLKHNSTGIDRRNAGDCLKRLRGREQASLGVEGISLIQSLLQPQGTRYIRLHHAMLGPILPVDSD